eukprot:scaffold160217_cov30-Tisochrysis_lutea.AAC.6
MQRSESFHDIPTLRCPASSVAGDRTSRVHTVVLLHERHGKEGTRCRQIRGDADHPAAIREGQMRHRRPSLEVSQVSSRTSSSALLHVLNGWLCAYRPISNCSLRRVHSIRSTSIGSRTFRTGASRVSSGGATASLCGTRTAPTSSSLHDPRQRHSKRRRPSSGKTSSSLKTTT